MMREILSTLCILVSITSVGMASVNPGTGEMMTADRWANVVFEGVDTQNRLKPGLEVRSDWDRVQLGTRYGLPMCIGGVKYDRGIYCHAPSEIVVHLPGAAKKFSSLIGIDDALQWDVRDYQSGPLWPELIFSIEHDGSILFKSSPIKAPGYQAVPVEVNLDGADEFTLKVNGTRFDEWGEADWANTKVVMEDESIIYLDQLPMLGSIVDLTKSMLPFSFEYDGQKSSSVLKTWVQDKSVRRLDANRLERTLSYVDPATGLEVRCVSIQYLDFPTIEWTIYFRNGGERDTPIISDIQSLDLQLCRGPGSEFVLHHSLGSSCRADDYRPIETVLHPGMQKMISPLSGFSCDPNMPYFNIDSGSGEGVIVAVGWPGQWSTDFIRDKGKGLHILAGQQITHFKLHPGEEVRTPLIVLQFWQGNYIRSQNIWRRWFIAHNMPKPGGKAMKPILAATTYGLQFMQPPMQVTEEQQKHFIDLYEQSGINLDWWWIDWGWHEGTWEPARDRFPNGLLPVTDYARSKGLKTIVWFAPEQAPLGGKKEWMLSAKGTEPLNRGADIQNIDLGNADAWNWVVNMIDERIVKYGIDCFRLDGGWGPLPNWRTHDGKDRQGITENHYISGFLALYDELLRRHPKLMIDNCCRGGRRNDVETMRRSVPLWRTDYLNTAVSQQCHSYGISYWLPMSGIENMGLDPYEFRSRMTPSVLLDSNIEADNKIAEFLKHMTRQWRDISNNYFGDYYPLTPYTTGDGEWMAWQFDNPESGEGFIQVFCRAGISNGSMSQSKIHIRPEGLISDANYSVWDIDEDNAAIALGRHLMNEGIMVEANEGPRAWIFVYKKAQD